MRNMILKIKAILSGKRGESLMESVASLFIYLILLMAITAMIKTALQITSVYTKESGDRQNAVNDIVMERNSGAASSENLLLQGGGIDVTIPVELFQEDGYEAFRPEVPE